MYRLSPLIVALACVSALVSGCGSNNQASDTASHTTKTIKVSISGDSVSPNGDRVSVAVDQPITLDVTADKAGEIHVHSTPEQELEYQAGHTEISMKPITTPGLIEVESHALEKTIVQLEVK